MASVTKASNEKDMADEDDQDQPAKDKGKGKGEQPEPLAYGKPNAKIGYFTIYKSGQGYWTRFGTVSAVGLVGAFVAYSLYDTIPTLLSYSHNTSVKIAAGIAAVFVVAYSWLAWHLLNRPGNVDFLIATDSEMKKVNWTSRTELIGSTKVVIVFMFLVALFLFTTDQAFAWLMYWINILKVSPLG